MEALSEQNSPDWLGLPNNAEQVLLASVAHNLVINLLKMHQLDEELAYSYGEAKGKLVEDERHGGLAGWDPKLPAAPQENGGEHQGRALQVALASWSPWKRDNLYNLTRRFFKSEVNFGLKLLQSVRLDLEDMATITSKTQTNHHRSSLQLVLLVCFVQFSEVTRFARLLPAPSLDSCRHGPHSRQGGEGQGGGADQGQDSGRRKGGG